METMGKNLSILCTGNNYDYSSEWYTTKISKDNHECKKNTLKKIKRENHGSRL